MKKFLQEFKEFALRGNVMDLAIGVIIGAAFQAIINSMVNDVLSPLIGLIANTDLSYLVLTIGDVDVKYGSFLTAVIFLLVKGMNALAGLGHKKDSEEEETPTEKNCPFCYGKIDIKATRCPHCTSMIESVEMEAEKED